jgi:hypothetical protein
VPQLITILDGLFRVTIHRVYFNVKDAANLFSHAIDPLVQFSSGRLAVR